MATQPEAPKPVTQLTADEATQESVSRLRRMETRIYKLCDFLGVDPAPTTMPLTLQWADTYPFMNLPGYDVTVSSLKHALEKYPMAKDKPVRLMVNGKLIATLRFA